MDLLDAYLKAKDFALSLRSGRGYMPTLFGEVHAGNLWGDAESVSGRGSTLAATEAVRRELPGLLARHGVRSLLDAPCGDFNWMRHVNLGVLEYFGVDVVPELVAVNREKFGDRFAVADISRDPLPRADLILCRDCLIHFSYRFIRRALSNFERSGATFLLTTTYPDVVNRDILTGQWRPLNLQAPPFNLPAPLDSIDEGEGRLLALWRLA